MFKSLEDICTFTTGRVLFVGVGNVLKSDDGVGVYITRNIKKSEKCISLPVEVSIENYIGKINSLRPDILIIIDCVDLNSEPGTFMLLNVDQIEDFTFNTHNISLNKLSEFFDMPVYVLGLQPEKIEFGEKISSRVLKTANSIINKINTRKK